MATHFCNPAGRRDLVERDGGGSSIRFLATVEEVLLPCRVCRRHYKNGRIRSPDSLEAQRQRL
jgi:hypothetical protein